MTVIPVLSRNTVTSLVHRGTVPHRRFDFFFYSNKNYFVQLEDTKIKTECVCSMKRTEQTRVFHHSSLGLHCRGCPDQILPRDSFPEYNAVTVGNWCNLNGSRQSNNFPFPTSFQNSISALYSYRAPVQPALGPLCACCMTCMNQCFVLFAGSEHTHSMCSNAQSRLAAIIYNSQTELQKQVVMSD